MGYVGLMEKNMETNSFPWGSIPKTAHAAEESQSQFVVECFVHAAWRVQYSGLSEHQTINPSPPYLSCIPVPEVKGFAYLSHRSFFCRPFQVEGYGIEYVAAL